MDAFGELLLDIEEIQQQDELAAMVELGMVDEEDVVGLDSQDAPATKMCVPGCDTPSPSPFPSLKPLPDISEGTLSRILGQSTPASQCLPYISPVPTSPQQVSLPIVSSTVSSTTSPNPTGNQVSARLNSFSRDL